MKVLDLREMKNAGDRLISALSLVIIILLFYFFFFCAVLLCYFAATMYIYLGQKSAANFCHKQFVPSCFDPVLVAFDDTLFYSYLAKISSPESTEP